MLAHQHVEDPKRVASRVSHEEQINGYLLACSSRRTALVLEGLDLSHKQNPGGR